jgi:hypothetical protein
VEAKSINNRIGWYGGTRYCQLRHCATSRKDVGSMPDEVIGFFNWPNPSGRTMALGSTKPLTEMSTRNLPGVKGGRRVRLTTLPSYVSQVCRKFGSLDVSTLWASTACYRDSILFFNKMVKHKHDKIPNKAVYMKLKGKRTTGRPRWRWQQVRKYVTWKVGRTQEETAQKELTIDGDAWLQGDPQKVETSREGDD